LTGQTLGGVFTTGTHGSCFIYGPLAETIVSIDMVRINSSLVRIGPSNSITNPAALATEHPDLQLIQNDDYFYAGLINMGTIGVVHSYVLEVTDAFHMKEVRTTSK
jgi:FAD/FMN-containing dehydrogenase